MIGYLEGTPVLIGTTTLLVVNGVGYQVSVGAKVLQKLQVNQAIGVYIHTHVKEDALELYGFLEAAEKELFLLLLGISGVGPRTALAITELGKQAIQAAVQEADIATFTQAPRVGKKLAQKIIIELKSKLGSIKELNLAEPSAQQAELYAALEALGFSEQDIAAATKELDTDGKTVEELLPVVLKQLRA